MKTKIRNIHMVGIGGAGMSGIAEVLLNLGYTVSGSDMAENEPIHNLKRLGAVVHKGHAREHLAEAEVVVKSTAVSQDNPEVMEAKARGVPVIPRAEMLAELMRLKTGIAVAGTHGKTTTTSLLGTVFKEAGFDPTVIIGGRLNAYGSNALMGQGEYLIAEADESDGSFLCLFPIMTIVTNVDADHLDYYPDLDAIKEAFIRFMNQVPFYGVNLVCGDDPHLKSLLPEIKRPVVTYGFEPGNDLRGEVSCLGSRSTFRVFWKEEYWGEVSLEHPGKHNIQNALGVIGLAMQADIAKESILRGLETFAGVGRRMERKGERGGVLVLDDYGHHPREIQLTLETVKEVFAPQRLIVVFQPHRFTRTRALFGEFCKSFPAADYLLLTEIYPAAEDPIPGVSGTSLAHGIRQVGGLEVDFCADYSRAVARLREMVRSGDVVITLGAGPVFQVGERFLGGE